MILKNGKIFSEGLIHNGDILISSGVITKIKYEPDEKDFKNLVSKNQDNRILECENRLILPGIIDIHSHLRDMGQSEKETFFTGTLAAAYSGITTIFNMPNTKPPAITVDQVKKWMDKAKNNINVDVGFIAGVPKGIDDNEIKKIIDLGIIGFKIYPLSPLSEVDWEKSANIQKILNISSKYQVPIFIHAAFPLSDKEKDQVVDDINVLKFSMLEFHDALNPVRMEENYCDFVIQNYKDYIVDNKPEPKRYPIIHFCHVSCKEAYLLIQKAIVADNNFRISYEVTPHHLLLSKDLSLDIETHGKVLPPLRSREHSQYLLNKLKEGKILLIGTDHAPHTIEEKSQDYLDSPSGFPGFETYPKVILDQIFKYGFSLGHFVSASSENPATIFNLRNKGYIKEGYDADLMIVETVPEYLINPANFKTKAKFSPFEKSTSIVRIWKVFLRGNEINIEKSIPKGTILKASYKV
ncbi:MAG: dihydroorotase [Promethearchaeota archaeon]|jgi:dihydroorotase